MTLHVTRSDENPTQAHKAVIKLLIPLSQPQGDQLESEWSNMNRLYKCECSLNSRLKHNTAVIFGKENSTAFDQIFLSMQSNTEQHKHTSIQVNTCCVWKLQPRALWRPNITTPTTCTTFKIKSIRADQLTEKDRLMPKQHTRNLCQLYQCCQHPEPSWVVCCQTTCVTSVLTSWRTRPSRHRQNTG